MVSVARTVQGGGGQLSVDVDVAETDDWRKHLSLVTESLPENFFVVCDVF